METNTWIYLLGTLILAVVALFQEHFKRWWFRPELDIEFKHAPPWCLKTKGMAGEKESDLYYFRLSVYNKGRSQAKHCEVTLDLIACANVAGEFRWED